jgi:hypothetical protein
MTEEKAVIVSESVQMGSVQAHNPEDVISRAKPVAKALAKIIKDRKLFTPINGKNYVQADGCATLGNMLGVVPRERESTKIENGYLAYVELVRTSDGMIIGGASAICTREERNWSNRDEYAIKSMATTRAMGKAYRLAFSWIVNLAGYESTPAEEMIIDAEVKEIKHELKTTRPLAPEKLADMIAKRADKYRGEKATADDSAKKKLIANLAQLTTGDDNLRHELTEYLTGEQSTKKLDDGNILALNDWLNSRQDSSGEWMVDGMASKEYKRIVEEVFGNGAGK